MSTATAAVPATTRGPGAYGADPYDRRAGRPCAADPAADGAPPSAAAAGTARSRRRAARTDDAELGAALARARAGDEAAFSTLYRSVQPSLLRHVRRLVGDDAEDVTADAWHDIVRDLAGFRGDGPAFRGWAATIARHRALDHLRRAGARPRTTALDAVPAEPAPAPDSAALAIDNLSTADALALIASLPREQAEAVLLRVVLGLSGPEAAQLLGKRPGAVRTAAHRGLRRLAEQLTPGPARGPADGAGDAPDGAPGVPPRP